MFLHLIVDSDGNASALVYVLIANDNNVYKCMYIMLLVVYMPSFNVKHHTVNILGLALKRMNMLAYIVMLYTCYKHIFSCPAGFLARAIRNGVGVFEHVCLLRKSAEPRFRIGVPSPIGEGKESGRAGPERQKRIRPLFPNLRRMI